MSWIEVRAILPPVDDASPFIEVFREHGIECTQQEKDCLFGCLADVEGTRERVERLESNLRSLGAPSVESHPLEEQNWDEMWRQFFHPQRIGQRIVVRPTWEPFQAGPDDLVIVLDPGEAFGTGDHPTTRLCLRLLEGACPAGGRIADIGCGSGILAIAARLLGAGEVVAVDIDPTSVEVARGNAALNKVDVDFSVGDGLPTRTAAGYDLVVSNIISAVLMQMAPHVSAALRPGGAWIVSGILNENWPLVLSAATRSAFVLEQRIEESDWVAATFRLPSPSGVVLIPKASAEPVQ